MPIEAPPYPGFPDGMVWARAQHELADTEARYIQDALIDKPGETRRRGPVQNAQEVTATFAYKGSGLVLALDPTGATRLGVLTGDESTGLFSVFSDALDSLTDFEWPHPLPTKPQEGAAKAYKLVDAKPALKGGTLIGVSNYPDARATEQALALWRGANTADVDRVNMNVTRGDRTVTGTGFLGYVSPGQFLFGNTDEGYTNAYLGYVESVESNTVLTLGEAALYDVTSGTIHFQALRGIAPMVARGDLTCATDSDIVNGGDTLFQTQGLATGTWNVYRRRDREFVGTVESVESEISLTLTGNAAIAMADEPYFAVRADADYSLPLTPDRVGWLTDVWARRQWFVNIGSNTENANKTIRAHYSEPTNMEALDVSEDGNWIPIYSVAKPVEEGVKAVAAAFNGLLFIKETETFILTGESPETFAVNKLWDDGTLSTMSVAKAEGGVIWAGKDGIHFYDGTQVTNLMDDKFGHEWKTTLHRFDPDHHRMWATVARGHYILHIERVNPSVPVLKGAQSETQDHWIVLVNLANRAVTLFTNVGIRGAAELPSSLGRPVWALINDELRAHVVDTDVLFDQEGRDAFAADNEGAVMGPDFYIETKKFTMGDPLRLKRWRQVAWQYIAQGGYLNVDVVLGLNDDAVTLSSVLPESAYTWRDLGEAFPTWRALSQKYPTWSSISHRFYVPKRIRFLKTNQSISFRIYQSDDQMTRVKLGPFHVGFKWMRVGRVR